MLLGLHNGEIEVRFDLVVNSLHLHKDMMSFTFVSLDLAMQAVDFICSMAQLTHRCVSPLWNSVELDWLQGQDIFRFTIISADYYPAWHRHEINVHWFWHFLWISGSSILLVTSLNTLGEALNKIIVLTGGSLMTDGRVTQTFQKEKMRSNNSNEGN
jgi:hypothetical protein